MSDTTTRKISPEQFRQAYAELGALKCVCGAKKQHKHSFCRTCYFVLPQEMRSALYDADIYPEVHTAAKEKLRELGRISR